MLSYNRSTEYLNTVRSWFSYYQRGTHEVPDGAGTLPTTPSTPLPPSRGASGLRSERDAEPEALPVQAGRQAEPEPLEARRRLHQPDPTPKPPTPPPASRRRRPRRSAPWRTRAPDRCAPPRAHRSTSGSPSAPATRSAPAGQGAVTFTVTGDTGTLFAGGKKTVVVRTGADGTATAPELRAGEKAGEFTVTATAGIGRPRT